MAKNACKHCGCSLHECECRPIYDEIMRNLSEEQKIPVSWETHGPEIILAYLRDLR